VHGIGDVDAEELRRKRREWEARQPVQRCGVDGCEFQTKDKSNLKEHHARVHGIGDVDAEGRRGNAEHDNLSSVAVSMAASSRPRSRETSRTTKHACMESGMWMWTS
jgi:hypothetical protein